MLLKRDRKINPAPTNTARFASRDTLRMAAKHMIDLGKLILLRDCGRHLEFSIDFDGFSGARMWNMDASLQISRYGLRSVVQMRG